MINFEARDDSLPQNRTIIRSKAPLRISFGGGGTDVDPYPQDCDCIREVTPRCHH